MNPPHRVERTRGSVIALRGWLLEINQKPNLYRNDHALIEGLKSQGRLAKLANPALGVVPSSLNTIKRICEVSLDGGFDSLDRLRKSALYAVTKSDADASRPKSAGKAQLQIRLRTLEHETRRLRQDLLRLTGAFETSMRQARDYANSSGQLPIIARCKREQRELRDIVSLLDTSTQRSEVNRDHEEG